MLVQPPPETTILGYQDIRIVVRCVGEIGIVELPRLAQMRAKQPSVAESRIHRSIASGNAFIDVTDRQSPAKLKSQALRYFRPQPRRDDNPYLTHANSSGDCLHEFWIRGQEVEDVGVQDDLHAV